MDSAAELESIAVDGPITEIKHSGLPSSGWDLNFSLEDEENLTIGGTDSLAGAYTKGKSDCPMRDIKDPWAENTSTKSDSGSSNATCERYISCACALEKEDSSMGGQCDLAKAAVDLMKLSGPPDCSDSREIQKAMKGLWEFNGHSWPYQCR